MRRTALITRCAQTLYDLKPIVYRLASDGFDIAISDNPSVQTKLATLQGEVEASGCTCRYYLYDGFDETDIQRMINAVSEYFGGLDVVMTLVIRTLLESVCLHPPQIVVNSLFQPPESVASLTDGLSFCLSSKQELTSLVYSLSVYGTLG